MRNKIALASAALIAASGASQAEIVINDFLSFEGFVDMSYTHVDNETSPILGDESENSWQIDQVEISWLFDFDVVTAQIDLQHEDLATDDDDNVLGEGAVEQAFATYHFDNGAAITAGRYASMIGFEAFEPTGLYQYSFAYDIHYLEYPGPSDTATGDITIIPGYAQGVKFTYETDTTFFGISVQDEAFDYDGDRFGGDGDSSWAVEVAGSVNFDNGLTWFLGGAYEDGDDVGSGNGDSYMLNSYVTFETGAWIFAGELNYGESESGAFFFGSAFGEGDEEVLQALLMANFAYSEKASITGRLSYGDHEGADTDLQMDFLKYTLAHGYAFTDNLFLVNEVSFVDGEYDNGTEWESLLVAVELIFSF